MIGFDIPECGICACLIDGLRYRQIAAATGQSYSMVRRRIRRLQARFGTPSRAGLTAELDRIARDVR